MKKLLLSLAVCALGALSSQAADERYITRAAWQITPCSEINEGNGSGYATAMIDDNVNTYWHSNWSNDTAQDAYHWFIIDMGFTEQVDGVDYWRRQGNQNGQFYSGKVYVSNTAFTPFADHAAAKAYFDNADNVAAGSFTFTYDENADDVRRCAFTTPATGRYLLVILSNSGANDMGRHACCGDFKAFTTSATSTADEYARLIHKAKTTAEAFAILKDAIGGTEVPSTDAPADLTAENLETAANATNAALQAYVNSYNKAQIFIQCAYRRGNGYLAAIPQGNNVVFNTIATPNPDAVWSIMVQDNGIRLYNRTTGYYIGTDNGPKLAANAQLLIPRLNNTDKVAFAKGTSNNLLNVNTGADPLTNWHVANDEGSSWNISVAGYDAHNYVEPVASTADAPKYYRIVNARWMFNNESPALAVNGENQDGNGIGENTTRATANIPGVYWRLEDAGNGACKLVNLTGYKLNYSGTARTTMSEEGAPVYLYKQTDARFNGATCYGLSRSDNASTTNTYLDASGEATSFVWSPTNESNGNGNNGSLWYFIAAEDNEISTAVNSYISSIRTRIGNVPYTDSNLAELFGEEFAAELEAKTLTKPYTVAEANAAKVWKTANADNVAQYIADVKAAVEAKISDLENKSFIISNGNVNYSNKYLSVAEDKTAPTAEINHINTIWKLETTETAGQYLLRSIHHGGAISRIDTQSQPIPLTDEGLPYQVAYNPAVPGFNFTLCPTTEGEDMTYYALHQSNNTVVCKWVTQNIDGSHWHMSPLGDATVSIAKADDNSHRFDFGENVTVNTHQSAAALTATIAPKTQGTRTISPDETGTYTVTAADLAAGTNISGLAAGAYTLTAPAGMFLVNGKPAGAVTNEFTVTADGSTVSIAEVEAAAQGADVVYDLSGRRVSKAVRGLYIINGKKVMVK